MKSVNNKIVMLAIGNGYNNYVKMPDSMSAECLLELMTAQAFQQNYNSPWEIAPSNIKLDVVFVSPEELPTPENAPVLEMNEILAENNRLAREVEKLEKLLKTAQDRSQSKEIDIIG